MCLLLDVNAFSPFFESSNSDHQNFKEAMIWVTKGDGKLIYGGAKYNEELKNTTKYLRIFAALEKAGKVVRLNDKSVNALQEKIEEIETSRDFDDPHLIAIVCESKCRIVCTNDRRAIPYIKDNKFYPSPLRKPKIYRYKRHKTMLTDANIVEICRCGA